MRARALAGTVVAVATLLGLGLPALPAVATDQTVLYVQNFSVLSSVDSGNVIVVDHSARITIEHNFTGNAAAGLRVTGGCTDTVISRNNSTPAPTTPRSAPVTTARYRSPVRPGYPPTPSVRCST